MNKIKNSLINFGAALMLLVSLVIASCGQDDLASPTSARVRFVHAIPDSSRLNVFIDGKPLNFQTSAFNNSGSLTIRPDTLIFLNGFPRLNDSSYISVLSGERSVKLSPVSAPTAIKEKSFSFEAGKNYSVFAVDSVRSADLFLIEDNFPPRTDLNNKAGVRIGHLSPNAGNVDVTVTLRNRSNRLAAPRFDTIRSNNVAYKGFTGFDIRNNDTITSIVIRRTGGDTTRLLNSTATFTLLNGRNYTFIAAGGARGFNSLRTAIITHSR